MENPFTTNPSDSAAPIVIGGEVDFSHYGLTKREEFARSAMQGVLAGNAYYANGDTDRLLEAAAIAVVAADALIAALNGSQDG